jgi:hypothetical protein
VIIPIAKYKDTLIRNFQPKIESSISTPGKSNSLRFPLIGSSKKDKKIATQTMLIRVCAVGFYPLSFSSNPGGKLLLEWYNGGSLPIGVSKQSLTRRMQIYHSGRQTDISNTLSCFKHDDTTVGLPTLSDDIHLYDRLLALQQDIWSNSAQVKL